VTVFTTALTPTAVTGRASNLTATEGSATLNATVNPEGVKVTSCIFEYGPTTSYGSTVECEPEPGSGSSPIAVHADISGLEVGRYHFRVIAVNANGESQGEDSTFVAGAKPVISGQTLAGVSSSAAKIEAQLNPEGLSTTYQLQYGTTTGYGSSTALENAGDALGSTGVLVPLSGLSQATEYHARLIAGNALGTTAGPDIAFTTSSAGGASASSCPNKHNSGFSSLLPDCRAYEAVSPGGGPGEVYVPAGPETVLFSNEDIITELPMRAAAQGGAVAYIAEPGEKGGVGAIGRGLGNQFLATRDADQHRWGVSTLTPQASAADEPASNPIYESFSSNLATGILASNSQFVAAEATPAGPRPCNVLYSRTSDALFHALFTKTLTPGSCGFLSAFEQLSAAQRLVFAGASEGTSETTHLLFQSPAPLSDEAEASTVGDGSNLYESIDGSARLVSMLPGEVPDANAVLGGAPSDFQLYYPDFENVISADGSRIFWTDLTSGRIYMRLSGTSTISVSEGAAKYWSATPDGHYVFYTEGEKLLRYDAETAEREELAGTGAGVQGVAGVGENGSYVYFVAAGALASGAEVRNCRTALEEKEEKSNKGELTLEEEIRLNEEQHVEDLGHLPKGRGCNLYVRHAGVTTFVATLGGRDNALRREAPRGFIRIGDWQSELGSRTAQATDSGQELVFQSTQQLTGYDNSRLSKELNPEHGVEVFVYDAASGELTCASCDPAGTPPAKEAPAGAGTYLPVSLNPTAMRRWSSTDGSRVFFASSQPLVPQDSNGVQDIYEWEREGTPGCPTATSKWGGCISLISGGDSNDRSFFVDASADGDDVFFTHRGRLAGAGRPGDRAELFDARVDGGFPEESTGCSDGSCQGALPSPQSFSTSGSESAVGGGNYPPPKPPPAAPKHKKRLTRAQLLAKALKACHAKPKRKRSACEKQARKRYGLKAKGRKAATHKGRKGKSSSRGGGR
jgi:hypothetical protein